MTHSSHVIIVQKNSIVVACVMCMRAIVELSLVHFQLDTDRNGLINIRELKSHLRNHQCQQLPENLASHILRMHDDDMNGQLDFEEFYRLSVRQEWLFSRMLMKYCRLIVPSPHRPEQDETGKHFTDLPKT